MQPHLLGGSATDATTAHIVIEVTTTDVPNILIILRFRIVFFKMSLHSASFIFKYVPVHEHVPITHIHHSYIFGV